MSKDIGISVEELVLEEREFLHEVSNHTSIAHGMINIVLKKMKAGQEIDEKLLSKQQKAIDALNCGKAPGHKKTVHRQELYCTAC